MGTTELALRAYQAKAIAEAQEHIRQGRRKVLIVMPTGGGKTCTASAACVTHSEQGEYTVWLAHRRELVKQAQKTLHRFGLRAGAFGRDQAASIQVEMIQTLLKAPYAPPATLCVADEAHHLLADEWSKLAETYADAALIGLTATPIREDGRPMGDIFDVMVVACQISDLIKLNAHEPTQGLVECDVIRPEKSNKTKMGVLKPGEIGIHPVDGYLEYMRGKRAICYAANIPAAKQFCEEYNKRGVRAELILGTTRDDERDSAIARYKRGDVQVLVNVHVLTEGFDEPATEGIIIARSCPNPGLYMQICGRGLRPSPGTGKQKCICLDLRGVSRMFGLPTEDRDFDLKGIAIKRHEEKEATACRICDAVLVDGTCPNGHTGGASRVLDVPIVVNAEMELVTRTDAEGVVAPPERVDERVRRLAKWIHEARVKQFKPMWALYTFQRAFKYRASKELIEKAKELAATM